MKSIFALGIVLIFTADLVSCNPNPAIPASPTETAPAIIVVTWMETPTPTPTSTNTLTPTKITATTKPTLYINNDNTKCRSGPGQAFRVIASFNKTAAVDLIARDTADGYWFVRDLASKKICWIQAVDVTPSGSYDNLPDVTPQASTKKIPAGPGGIKWRWNCLPNSSGGFTVKTDLLWLDSAGNENGYRIYRSGTLIADLPPNSTTYSDTIDIAVGSQYIYSVEAYNYAGSSFQISINPVTCPP